MLKQTQRTPWRVDIDRRNLEWLDPGGRYATEGRNRRSERDRAVTGTIMDKRERTRSMSWTIHRASNRLRRSIAAGRSCRSLERYSLFWDRGRYSLGPISAASTDSKLRGCSLESQTRTAPQHP